MILRTLFFILTIASVATAHGQSVRTSATQLAAANKSDPWPISFYYGANSDFADNRDPRGYTHSLGATIGYQIDQRWSLGSSLGLRAETIGGQIPKGDEQSHAETLSPSTSFSLGYGDKFGQSAHTYGLYLSGEPLWNEGSRLEGYKGVVGVGGKLGLSFFDKGWVMGQSLDVSELINSYTYGSSLEANPGHFYTYKFSNVFRIYGALKFSYTWGMKLTRYLDDYTSYTYNNSYGLSYSVENLVVALSYDAGGFTDDGEVSMWFIDDYRRIGRLAVAYTF